MDETKTEKDQNLELWLEVEKTDPTYTTEAEISGRKVTSIDAYIQIKNATQQFGKYGEKWGLKDTSMDFKVFGETTLCLYKATFYAGAVEFPIYNSIKVCYMTRGQQSYLKIDDDFAKKVETNTITKALTRLGFNTDVFMGKFEDAMYVKEVQVEFETEKIESYMDKLEDTKTIKELEKAFMGLPARMKINKDIIALKDELKKQYENSTVSK